jgi:hypothetical protein
MMIAYQRVLDRCRVNQDTSLELRGNEVDDETLAHLFRHKHLKELHIVGAKQVTNAGLSYIENLRNLEWLNLDGLAITDKGLAFLQQMSRLRGLQLTNAFLTGCGLEYLLTMKTLEYLELDGTNVDDRSLQTLAKIKSLKTLRLNDTAITDKGVRKLQQLKKLKTLFLQNTHVSEACVKKLRKHLVKCEIYWSAYQPPKPALPVLPRLFIRPVVPTVPDTPTWILQTLAPKHFDPQIYPPDYDPGAYLKLVEDTSKIRIELRRWHAPKPDYFLKGSSFKPSQPSWFELLDWKDEH